MVHQPQTVTRLLNAASGGDDEAQRELWTIIHQELRSIARHQLACEAAGHTLQPTALVHEAWFRLFGGSETNWSSRGHFFSAAARAMRRIRIDDARKRNRLKRGGGRRQEGGAYEPVIFDQDPAEVLAVHEALSRLEREEPRKAKVVMLRYFAGLSEEETAAALNVSRRTVQMDWQVARAWLHRELADESRSDDAANHDETGQRPVQ